jgi:predicted nucleic acid-binding protein
VHWAIFDTSVYINHWEGVLAEDALASVRSRFIVRQSAVVLSELRRGARTNEAKRLVDELYSLAAIRWTPAEDDWWQAGLLIRKIGDSLNWDRRKRQEFQNDTLIVLTARRHGAAVVTANAVDFELLGKELKVPILGV